jgi:mannose-6-phosphate isomerase-like protein (cupin superfamily)
MAVMEGRVVRYADLRPCTTAFIDTRSPGSDRKENFTIIGPGVAENPDQHVHIPEPHGFNIGAARQPPYCTNSQHSHETAEVFVVHTGTWKMVAGVDKGDAAGLMGPGDVISIPTRVFRGFENVGTDTGFLYAVLGGDDPGRVTWAPDVLEKARAHGLILLENGALIDTLKGQTVPPGGRPVTPLTAAEVAEFLRVDDAALARCIVTGRDMVANPDSPLAAPGVAECPVIGIANPAEAMPQAPLGWAHGFHLRRLDLAPGAATRPHRRLEEEVLFVRTGSLTVQWDGGRLDLGPGDTMTVPKGLRRRFANGGAVPAEIFVTRGGDHPAAPVFD